MTCTSNSSMRIQDARHLQRTCDRLLEDDGSPSDLWVSPSSKRNPQVLASARGFDDTEQ